MDCVSLTWSTQEDSAFPQEDMVSRQYNLSTRSVTVTLLKPSHCVFSSFLVCDCIHILVCVCMFMWVFLSVYVRVCLCVYVCVCSCVWSQDLTLEPRLVCNLLYQSYESIFVFIHISHLKKKKEKKMWYCIFILYHIFKLSHTSKEHYITAIYLPILFGFFSLRVFWETALIKVLQDMRTQFDFNCISGSTDIS